MFSDSESDDDYTSDGAYKGKRHGVRLRVLEDELFEIKHHLRLQRTSSDDIEELRVRVKQTDKDYMREHCTAADASWWDDWRHIRVERTFREVEGFHLGYLDLSGRSKLRYSKLAERLLPFAQDFWKLKPYVVIVQEESKQWSSDQKCIVSVLVDVPVVGHSHVWSSFCARWKVPQTVHYNDLLCWLTNTSDVMTSHPVPVFQQLWLTGLPPELLYLLFEYLTVDEARRLSATCKHLRDIGVSRRYTTRCLSVECSLEDFKSVYNATSSEEGEETMNRLMSLHRDACIEHAQFLASRPDICARISSVSIRNEWRHFRGTDATNAISILSTETYYGPLMTQLTHLLEMLRLQTLSVFNMFVDVDFVSGILRQPLDRLHISLCLMDRTLQQHLLTTSLRSSITQLILCLDPKSSDPSENDLVRGLWCFLAVCPRLRLLHVSNYTGYPLPYPLESDWPFLIAINNLERIHLDGIDFDLSVLTPLFASAVERGPLRLTHFKLYSPWSMEDSALLDFLGVIHASQAPLRVLALDGIYPLTMAFVNGLATLFPELEGLTLIRRDGLRQCQARRCQWPRPMYEYAEHLRPLTRLRHFAANFAFPAPALSPYAMRRLEPEYSDKVHSSEGWKVDYLDDERLVALPFAAQCPSLETFFVVSHFAEHTFWIKRLQGGGFDIDTRPPKGVDEDSIQKEWNPITGATFHLPPVRE